MIKQVTVILVNDFDAAIGVYSGSSTPDSTTWSSTPSKAIASFSTKPTVTTKTKWTGTMFIAFADANSNNSSYKYYKALTATIPYAVVDGNGIGGSSYESGNMVSSKYWIFSLDLGDGTHGGINFGNASWKATWNTTGSYGDSFAPDSAINDWKNMLSRGHGMIAL